MLGEMKDYPKISIITAVFNNVEYIEDCILSVLNQDYPALEYIVIDGASTDGTVEVVEKYRQSLSYFTSEEDKSQTHALNKGFRRATGDILAWLNADEEYRSGTLWEVRRVFAEVPKVDFFYGNRVVVNSHKEEIGKKSWPAMPPLWHLLYRMQVLPTDASFWSARAHRLTGELDEENYPSLSMDYDWLLRLSLNVEKWKKTANYLSKYTERTDRATAQADESFLQKNSQKARQRVIQERRFSKWRLLSGWFIAGLWVRLLERRLSFPHIGTSLKNLFPISRSGCDQS
jgi:glycosyltransferase involved in cell wall biosynthesis